MVVCVERMEKRSRKSHRPFSHKRSQSAKLISVQNQVNIGYLVFSHVKLIFLIGFDADWLPQMKYPRRVGFVSVFQACIIGWAWKDFYDYSSSQLNTDSSIGETIAERSRADCGAKDLNQ
jgi:hypothetical protein